MADWWDVAQAGAEWWLKDKQTGDIESDVVGGYDRARKDIKKYAEPYQQTAQWGMEGYKQEGPFDFTYEGYLSSPEFQWLQDQTRQATERGAAAGQKGLYSGQTLADVSDRLYNVGAQAYDDEFRRQLSAQQARENYWWRPAQTGAVLAGSTGQSLADLAVGRGEARGAFEAQEAANVNSILKDFIPGLGDEESSMVGDAVKQLFDMMGGEEGTGGTLADFAKDVGGDVLKELGFDMDAVGEAAGKAWDWATGASAIASGAVEGWSAVPGMSSNFVMNDAGFIVDISSEGAAAAGEGMAAAGQAAGVTSDVMNFLSSPGGMGITAAALTLLMGGDVKDAAVTGGASYLGAALGTAIMPGIGTAIGGALGGVVANIGLSDKPAKADTVMMLSGSDEGFKRNAYATGAFGNVGFKGSATRHLNNIQDDYLPAFQTIAKIDDMVASALTEEEVAAVIDYGDRYTYRKKSNEGKISPLKVMVDSLKDRSEMVKKAIGEERFAELQLGDFYSGMIQQLKG